jgi:hypothetical protein
MGNSKSFFLIITAVFCSGLSGCASSSAVISSRPAWVDNPEAAADKRQFVSAVGFAADRDMAEKNALANLTAIFGQSIQADQKTVSTYQETVKNGAAADWLDRIDVDNTITVSTALETLVGAEIRDNWFDGAKTHYALAVMEKAKAAKLYSGLVRSNQEMINTLTAMNDTEKNTINGFSRYMFAATVADINASFANVLSVLGSPPPAGLSKSGDLRLEAANIAKTIPVAITVKGDRAGRIQAAFAGALSRLGFISGGSSSRYALNADFAVTPVKIEGQRNQFARYTLTANLTDTQSGAVLLPYSANGREGHITPEEAETRALSAAEKKINAEYGELLSERLSQLLPKK